MYILSAYQLTALLAHTNRALPREACGLLARREFKGHHILSFIGTPATDNTLFTFRIREARIRSITVALESSDRQICGCFHSHVLGAAYPSRVDSLANKEHGPLWLIYSVRFRELRLFNWDGKFFRRERLLIASAAECRG